MGWLMLGVRDVPILPIPALMRRDDLAPSDHIDGVADDAGVNGEASEFVRDGILHRIDLDVPVTMHFRFAPHHRLPTLGGEVEKFAAFVLLEPVPAAARLTPERGAMVDGLNLGDDRFIQIIQRREDLGP